MEIVEHFHKEKELNFQKIKEVSLFLQKNHYYSLKSAGSLSTGLIFLSLKEQNFKFIVLYMY